MKKRKKLGRKLLSFLLTLAMVVGLLPGMGLTAYAAVTEYKIFFTDALGWGDIHVYYWGIDGAAWPGVAMDKSIVNDYGQQVYTAVLPVDVEGIIFNGNGNQTVDITSGITNEAHWSSIDEKEGSNYKVESIGGAVDVTNLEGSGTADDPYQISTKDDWDVLAGWINSGMNADKYYKQTSDISGISVIVGNSQNTPFKGTYDGNGYTIEAAIDATDNLYAAPFQYADGAVIKNVKMTGSIKGGQHCSGLVGTTMNLPITIQSCEVAATITTTVLFWDGSRAMMGGLVGHGQGKSNTVSDCLFSGSFDKTASDGNYCVGAIYGWSGENAEVSNCLAYGYEMVAGNAWVNGFQFGRGLDPSKTTNCYICVDGTTGDLVESLGSGWIKVDNMAVPNRGQIRTHSVTITPGSNMTKTETSGAESQTDLSSEMIAVVYTADDGYYFPEDYSVAEVSGIKVTRDSYTQITVSGTPSADAEITLTAPTAKIAPDAPTAAATDCTTSDNNDGKLTGVTTAMEYKKSDAESWTAGTGSDITGLVPGTYYVRLKATDTALASANQELTIKGFISTTITFKVVNGSWDEGEGDAATADKTVTLTGHDGDTLKLTADQIPAVGTRPNDTYMAGSWDVTPSTETEITAATTYTYTYAAKEASVVTKAPEAKTLTYNGQAQELVTAGTATGGEMQYALGDATEATESYTTSIPAETNAGTYYVWYKVVGDDSHNDTVPEKIEVKIGLPFEDVKEGKYYYDSIAWAIRQNPPVASGVDATHFAPNQECTRAQAISFLYRDAGNPEVTVENPFTDVKDGKYYTQAVLWAYANKISSGKTADTFAPSATCTRAEFITFLWRMAGSPEVADAENPFTDVKDGKYYTQAVLWAVQNGIAYGTSETKFAPNDVINRGQAITFIYRHRSRLQ